MVIVTFFKEIALEASRPDAEKKCMDNYEHEQDLKNNEKHYCDQLAAMQEQLTVSLPECLEFAYAYHMCI